jgi:hypothetical protein
LSNPNSNSPAFAAEAPAFDMLRLPVVGVFLRWRHSRTVLQIPLLLISVVMILHGLLGPSLAPKNLATVLTWVHFRGVLVLVLLAAGNFFCLACPFMLLRNAMRRVWRPRWNWPRALRNKWPAIVLLGLILFSYELFDLWAAPSWTAWLIVGYFAAVMVVDGFFKHAAFCKYVCPIGQFNFVASTVSPLEVQVRDLEVCDRCTTKDCIRGTRQPLVTPASPLVVIQRGCELALFQPRKVGNMDCTFCLDCVHACPHDNIGVSGRAPGAELIVDPLRSGIGYFSRRKDLAALAIVFSFGALMNAFGMVSPIYALEEWLSKVLRVQREAPVLGLIFAFVLIVEPAVLLGLAAWSTRALGGSRMAILPLAVRYSYALVPLGFGMWLAHYGFHFLTGFLTVIPVTQTAVAETFGRQWLGAPLWTWTGLPTRFVQPIELGFLLLGLTGSLIVTHALAREDSPERPIRAFFPWAAVGVVIWISSVWLMLQPMEMRATFLGG